MAPVPISPINVGHIDDVQELTKTKPKSIPERFVRDITERPDQLSTSPTHMPIIDFSKLTNSSNTQDFTIETLKLASACEDWGFFQVKNHGVDLKLMESIEELSREFFMLPLEEKQKYPMIPGTVQGYGQAFVFSEDQKLDWCNMFALGIEPHYVRNPNLWPNRPEGFR
ncbi:Protein SRG1 [Senna tora]|uniref:Protein SRG1 n=1 Tax=Senna tora TaxID=362788 RepID=A0A834W9S3_9FABA|nr:Protein SRG1 [Senna tora]